MKTLITIMICLLANFAYSQEPYVKNIKKIKIECNDYLKYLGTYSNEFNNATIYMNERDFKKMAVITNGIDKLTAANKKVPISLYSNAYKLFMYTKPSIHQLH